MNATVDKVLGADAELGGFELGPGRAGRTGGRAARAVLEHIAGVAAAAPPWSPGPWFGAGLQAPFGATSYSRAQALRDSGRRFLPANGGCAYIDMEHLELCTPEVRSAREFVAAWHAMLAIAADALARANAELAAGGRRVVLLANASDGHGNAYGSHLSVLVTRRLWDDLFARRMYPGLFVLAAHQVSSIVYAGQGKVGSENGRPRVDFQLTQRGDFFERVVGLDTTRDRPLCNSRDEPLCGAGDGRRAARAPCAGMARLHCIFYDSTLMHVGTALKVGALQVVLSMLEAGRLGPDLVLDDPLAALATWGHDPTLRARARLSAGRRVTAVELQAMFCERARSHLEAGRFEGRVPDAAHIVETWEQTLALFERRDLDALSRRVDWVAKRALIEAALAARAGLDWQSAQAKHLDHAYAGLDPGEGLYRALERDGRTERLVPEAQVARRMVEPPPDTRARARATLLRAFPPERIRRVDWDRVDLDRGRPVYLPDPRDAFPDLPVDLAAAGG